MDQSHSDAFGSEPLTSIWLYLLWICVTAVAFWTGHRALRLTRDGVRRKGEVIELIKGRTSSNGTVWKPRVKFMDDRGNAHVFTSGSGASISLYSIGDVVTVVHMPGYLRDAEIFGFMSQWPLPIISSGFAIALTAALLGIA